MTSGWPLANDGTAALATTAGDLPPATIAKRAVASTRTRRRCIGTPYGQRVGYRRRAADRRRIGDRERRRFCVSQNERAPGMVTAAVEWLPTGGWAGHDRERSAARSGGRATADTHNRLWPLPCLNHSRLRTLPAVA